MQNCVWRWNNKSVWIIVCGVGVIVLSVEPCLVLAMQFCLQDLV